jgi:Ras-related protein Rab-2A
VELREEPSCADITIALVGNKCDLIEDRVVSRESVTAYAKAENVFFAETSAKLRENVDGLFAQVALAVTNSRPLGSGGASAPTVASSTTPIRLENNGGVSSSGSAKGTL